MLLVVAYVALCIGGMLEVAGVGFWGLDLLIGTCFTLAVLSGAGSYLFGSSPKLGLLGSGLGTVALVFHIWLNLA
jgi:hypothetical protein